MTARSFAGPEFVEKLRNGDEAAVRDVVRTYLPQVLRAARGAGLSEDDARDTTQNTFITFLEKLPEFEGRSHVRTFLFGILYRKIQETYRAVKREREHDDIDDVVETRFNARGRWSTGPKAVDLDLERAEVRAEIEDCLNGVSRNQRLALLLREVQGLSTDELCKVLEVSVTNLGVLLFRARNRMRECLEGKGVGLS